MRQIDRWTDKQTDIQIDRPTYGLMTDEHTDIQTDRSTEGS